MPSNNLQPVQDIAGPAPEAGTALCLSGGGYRAMLFHIGSIWRLNDAGLLGGLKRVSSVSGGSITAAVLGMNWRRLGLSASTPGVPRISLEQHLVTPLRGLAGTTIDEGAVLGGIFLSGTISDHITEHYEEKLFGSATLQDLPDDAAGPRFVINATNVQSGVLMRFSKPYIRDYRVGQILNPTLPLARAVAASSAFPPILSPCEIDVAHYGMKFEPGTDGEDLNYPPYTTKLVLSDGGVYDNLGLETAWKRYQTILVSDGGGHFQAEPDPHTDWARHSFRVLDLVDSQVRALRARQLMELFQQKERQGTYWGIRQHLAGYDPARTTALAQTATRLKKMDALLQERLINWGYAICDGSLRKFVDPALPSAALPYPASSI